RTNCRFPAAACHPDRRRIGKEAWRVASSLFGGWPAGPLPPPVGGAPVSAIIGPHLMNRYLSPPLRFFPARTAAFVARRSCAPLNDVRGGHVGVEQRAARSPRRWRSDSAGEGLG
ncbi:MAG: hypothetical protein ACK53L_13290, partial [Pirellulaceae bacterium]